MNSSIGKSSQSATDFAKNISKNITIPITMWDERLSTEASFKMSSELDINVSNRVKKIDEKAAAFILQGAIDFLSI
jgi:putative Holliday junction resolvase